MAYRKEDATERYPYNPLVDKYDYDEALDCLRYSRKDGKRDIPTFAQHMLERLQKVGLLHKTDTEPPDNVRKAKLDGKQDLWIRFDTRRVEDKGYMAVEVVDIPRSDKAILAAMVAYLAQPIDLQRLLEAARFKYSGAYAAESERLYASIGMEETGAGLPRIPKDQDLTVEELHSVMDALEDLRAKIKPLWHLEYLLPLIQYYRPEFDSCSPQEKQDLIEKTCGYINAFLESLRNLQAFLEYGAPNRKLIPAAKEPNRDVQAAVLRDVDGLTHRQIGEQMGIPTPPNFEIKGEHQTVRKMVERGRRILEGAFGEEGWWEQVKKMKAEKAWWRSLSVEERAERIRAEHDALESSALGKPLW